jgi:hypothetical protein
LLKLKTGSEEVTITSQLFFVYGLRSIVENEQEMFPRPDAE